MIRSLNLVPLFPYPPRSGGEVRIYHIYKHLSDKIEQTMLCRTLEPLRFEYLSECEIQNLQVKSFHIPRPSLLSKLIKTFSFLPRSYPLMLAGWYFRTISDHLKQSVQQNDFDIIVIESMWNAIYFPAISKSKQVKILSLYDIHSEALLRQAKVLKLGVKKLILLHDALKMKHLEKSIIKKFDLVLVTSEREKVELLKIYPSLRVAVAPNGVDCDAIRPLPFINSQEILFIGTMDYQPNIDGVLFFIKQVLPKLREAFPDLTFRVVGKDPVQVISRFHGINGVEIIGEVDDLAPHYQRSALCVVPLRSGSGTRLKILEAMAYGRPIVSTSIGCEGLHVIDGKHLLIANEPDDFVHAITKIITNAQLRLDLTTRARSLVQEQYCWSNIAHGIYREYEKLLKERSRLTTNRM